MTLSHVLRLKSLNLFNHSRLEILYFIQIKMNFV